MDKTYHQSQARRLFFRDGSFISARVQFCQEDISWLEAYKGESASERVWNLLNRRSTCHCGKLTSYIDFKSGYRLSCSRACAQRGPATFGKSARHSRLWDDPIWKIKTSAKMKETHFKNRSKKKLDELLEKDIVPLDDLSPGFDNEYRWQHECGEIFVKPFKALAGIYCPKCHVSKGQGELYELIRKNYIGQIIVNDRQQIKPKEIDIYLPAKKLGFEFNGKYWHQGDGIREAKKVVEAKKVGVNLVNIWEANWIKDRKKQEQLVLSFLS